MPNSFRQHLFLTSQPLAAKLWEPLIGPVISVLSFVCSIGNVPLTIEKAQVKQDQHVTRRETLQRRRDGLIRIGTTDRLYGHVHPLKAQLLGLEPGSFDVERARKHQFAALRTASRCEWCCPGTVLRKHIRQLLAHPHTQIRCRG